MSSKSLLLVLAVFGLALPSMGCGGPKAGVATGVDEAPQELSPAEEAAEKANWKKSNN